MDHRQTEQLLILASAIDSRRVTDVMVTAWQAVLADTGHEDALAALTAHRRAQPGVYLEPGHIVQQAKIERFRRRERDGIHPPPPPGKRWAVDAIESTPLRQVQQ